MTTDGLEIPGDLRWLVLLAVLLAVAWRVGVLREPSARRAVVAGGVAALLALPVMAWLVDAYSLPSAVWVVVFYAPIVMAMLLVWFVDRARTADPAHPGASEP